MKKIKQKDISISKRNFIFFLAKTLGFGYLFYRFGLLQIAQYNKFYQIANNNFSKNKKNSLFFRGNIYDSNGITLAMNENLYIILIKANNIQDYDKICKNIIFILNNFQKSNFYN